ncbi:hypothetical protein D3C81_20020 [compost metagenome]
MPEFCFCMEQDFGAGSKGRLFLIMTGSYSGVGSKAGYFSLDWHCFQGGDHSLILSECVFGYFVVFIIYFFILLSFLDNFPLLFFLYIEKILV